MSVRLKASAVELGHHAAHLHQDALGTYVARDTPGAHPHGIYNAIRHRRTGRLQRRAHRLHNYGGRRKPEHDQSRCVEAGAKSPAARSFTSAGRIRSAAFSATRRSASDNAVGCFQRLLSA